MVKRQQGAECGWSPGKQSWVSWQSDPGGVRGAMVTECEGR